MPDTHTLTSTEARSALRAMLAAIGTVTDEGTTRTIAAYAAAGTAVDDFYAVLSAEAGTKPVPSGVRTWSDVVKVLPWDGKGTTRTLEGFSESVVRRTWIVGHFTTSKRGPGQWLLACTRAAASESKDVREHSAYVRTRVSAYVQWVQAAAEGRVNKDGSINAAERTTGAASTRAAATEARDTRVSATVDAIGAAAAQGDAAPMELRTRPLRLGKGSTATPVAITVEMIANLTTDQLRELSRVIAAELKRRDDAATAAADAKLDADALAEAAALAAEAAAANAEGKPKRTRKPKLTAAA